MPTLLFQFESILLQQMLSILFSRFMPSSNARFKSNFSTHSTSINHGSPAALAFLYGRIYPMRCFVNLEDAPMLTFHQKRKLQKLIIEQNKILAGSPAPAERSEAERIKREALSKLGIAQVVEPDR
jgi:hypothetical protein